MSARARDQGARQGMQHALPPSTVVAGSAQQSPTIRATGHGTKHRTQSGRVAQSQVAQSQVAQSQTSQARLQPPPSGSSVFRVIPCLHTPGLGLGHIFSHPVDEHINDGRGASK